MKNVLAFQTVDEVNEFLNYIEHSYETLKNMLCEAFYDYNIKLIKRVFLWIKYNKILTETQKKYIIILARGYINNIKCLLSEGQLSPLIINKNMRNSTELYSFYIHSFLSNLYLSKTLNSKKIAQRILNDIHSLNLIPFPNKYDSWLLDIVNDAEYLVRRKICYLERKNK